MARLRQGFGMQTYDACKSRGVGQRTALVSTTRLRGGGGADGTDREAVGGSGAVAGSPPRGGRAEVHARDAGSPMEISPDAGGSPVACLSEEVQERSSAASHATRPLPRVKLRLCYPPLPPPLPLQPDMACMVAGLKAEVVELKAELE